MRKKEKAPAARKTWVHGNGDKVWREESGKSRVGAKVVVDGSDGSQHGKKPQEKAKRIIKFPDVMRREGPRMQA